MNDLVVVSISEDNIIYDKENYKIISHDANMPIYKEYDKNKIKIGIYGIENKNEIFIDGYAHTEDGISKKELSEKILKILSENGIVFNGGIFECIEDGTNEQ